MLNQEGQDLVNLTLHELLAYAYRKNKLKQQKALACRKKKSRAEHIPTRHELGNFPAKSYKREFPRSATGLSDPQSVTPLLSHSKIAKFAKICLASPVKKQKCRVKKQVRFDSSTKTWDGKRQEHILLERFALDYREFPPDMTVVEELYDARDTNMLLKMREVLFAAIGRIRRNRDTKHGVELIPGGGNFRIRATTSQIPHFKRMLASIEDMYDATQLMSVCEL